MRNQQLGKLLGADLRLAIPAFVNQPCVHVGGGPSRFSLSHGSHRTHDPMRHNVVRIVGQTKEAVSQPLDVFNRQFGESLAPFFPRAWCLQRVLSKNIFEGWADQMENALRHRISRTESAKGLSYRFPRSIKS